MMKRQLALFAESRRLVDLPIEMRLAGAAALLDGDPDLSVDHRRQLLLLVVAPQLYGEVER